MHPEIHGRVATGFELVLEQFRDVVAGGTDSADCCVHIDGEQVVDLRAGRREHDVQCVLSATKGAVAACANLLVDRGILDLETPVSRHWPEFGAHGKGATSVRDLLEHRAGVLAPDSPLEPGQLGDWDSVCAALAAASPSWSPGGGRYGYHAQSFGWLVGELVHRVDGRALVDFFASEVAGPSGADVLIGLPDSEIGRLLEEPPTGGSAPDRADDGDAAQFVGALTHRAMTLGGALPEEARTIPTSPRLRRLPSPPPTVTRTRPDSHACTRGS